MIVSVLGKPLPENQKFPLLPVLPTPLTTSSSVFLVFRVAIVPDTLVTLIVTGFTLTTGTIVGPLFTVMLLH